MSETLRHREASSSSHRTSRSNRTADRNGMTGDSRHARAQPPTVYSSQSHSYGSAPSTTHQHQQTPLYIPREMTGMSDSGTGQSSGGGYTADDQGIPYDGPAASASSAAYSLSAAPFPGGSMQEGGYPGPTYPYQAYGQSSRQHASDPTRMIGDTHQVPFTAEPELADGQVSGSASWPQVDQGRQNSWASFSSTEAYNGSVL